MNKRTPLRSVSTQPSIQRSVLAVLILISSLLLLEACQPAPLPPLDASMEATAEAMRSAIPTPTEAPRGLNSAEALEDFLDEAGIRWTFNAETVLTYLPGTARIYEIGDGTDSLQLTEYPTAEETDVAAGLFTPDAIFVEDLENPGSRIRVEWLGSPHVFRSERLLAVYIGDDAKILEALERAIGPQFAGS